MPNQRAFTIIGGDARIVRLANLLYEEGNSVSVYGICNHPQLKAPCSADLAQVVGDADAVILPLPMLNGQGHITSPHFDENIYLETVMHLVSQKQLLLAGKIPEAVRMQFDIKGIRYVDYFEREDLTVTNAMLTAQGAVQTLLNNYPDALCNANVLLLGYGRIGKFLCKLLDAFGSNITVAGRRSSTGAWVKAFGLAYKPIDTDATYDGHYDIIINTVPHPILTAERIDRLSNKCFILDLASGCGGTDFAHAEVCGIRHIHALSLPGKTVPLAAGAAIKNTVIEICNELEV